MPCNQDDRQLRIAFLGGGEQLKPAHSSHFDVGDDNAGMGITDILQGGFGRFKGHDT